ncbi:MAG TPA: heavy metal translocating P-type ATPase [Fimbriimonadaceae bacterium]|nr:heavy metal translocating P-type ATPase [Fimbriimonadaceae bacterium]HRJ32492.1 heavy metal translocating P-type ATPase [Fimbriimonadaceae bacterium]
MLPYTLRVRVFRDVQVLLTFLCGLFLVISFFGVHPAFPLLAVLCGSYFSLKSAWESLQARELDVNFLMVFAAIGAIIVGRPIDAAALLFLFSLSSTLEAYALARTQSAIEGLIQLRPEQAIRVGPGGDETVRVEALAVGEMVRVLPYEPIPTDGEVIQGTSSVNQAAMTGESQPVERGPGDPVLGGTQNQESMLLVRVSAVVGETTLDKIVHLVKDAQENKASGERLSAWFGQRYTLFVFGVFLVSLLVRWLLQQAPMDALYSALTLLVALSPCALVISTPATTLSALAYAARQGILVRGGEFIEQVGRVNALAIDKTGTLTTGQPRLVEICVCDSARELALVSGKTDLCQGNDACWHGDGQVGPEAQRLLQAAAVAEQYSTHPIADAIVRAAREQELTIPEADSQSTASGLGVVATFQGQTVRVGQRRFFEGGNAPIPPDFVPHIEKLQHLGMTVAVMEFEGRWAALGLRDEPRPEAKKVLDDLKALGVTEMVMITGDTPQTARAIADQVGIPEVRAGLMPDDKTRLIHQMIDENHRVMMVGDGINDAPSLSKAHVGVAMGGLGSDVALNAADVVLMQDKLERLPELIRLGRRTNSIIRANLFFAAGVILVLTLLSLFWTLPLPLAVLGHEGSTVLVILNGLRLLRGPSKV